MEREDDQQQQRPHSIHSIILDGIARLADRHYRGERHKLIVDGYRRNASIAVLDRHSLQHLVTFLDDINSHEVIITELDLHSFNLPNPSDGGLEILRSFFARSDTTLTKVRLGGCNFGQAEDASQLLMAFQTNRTVTDLKIQYIINLQHAAFGDCLCDLLQNTPQLQRLGCPASVLHVEGIRAFQPALQANRTLKELNLTLCGLGDDGIRIIADSLVGNTMIEVLDISDNDITSNGLDGITRLLESTQIKTIDLQGNKGVFGNEASTQRFAAVLSRHEFLKHLDLCNCEIGDAGIHLIVDGLVGNTTMEVLDIGYNDITSVGLADITRLLVSTQLKTIHFWGNDGVLNDEDATQHFVTTLQHQKSRVQELPIEETDDEDNARVAESYASSIENSLIRNQQLNHANLFLAPPPPQQQQQRNAGTMMLKLSHKAITKFAMVPNNAGASAIFTLFQARPALLEKRIKRPASAASAVSQEQKCRRL